MHRNGYCVSVVSLLCDAEEKKVHSLELGPWAKLIHGIAEQGHWFGYFDYEFHTSIIGGGAWGVCSMPIETRLTVANFLSAFFSLVGIQMAALHLWLLFVAAHTMLPSPCSQQPSV